MVDSIIGAMAGAVVGVVSFVIVKQIVAAQTTTAWSGAERAVVEVIPVAIGILVLIGVFSSLSLRR